MDRIQTNYPERGNLETDNDSIYIVEVSAHVTMYQENQAWKSIALWNRFDVRQMSHATPSFSDGQGAQSLDDQKSYEAQS